MAVDPKIDGTQPPSASRRRERTEAGGNGRGGYLPAAIFGGEGGKRRRRPGGVVWRGCTARGRPWRRRRAARPRGHCRPPRTRAGAEDADDAPLDSQLLSSIPWTGMSRATRRTFGWSWTWPGSSPSTAMRDGRGAGVRSSGRRNEREGDGVSRRGQRSGVEVLLLSTSQGTREREPARR